MRPEFNLVEHSVRSFAKQKNVDKIFLVTDLNVATLSAGFLSDAEWIVIPSGEQNKTLTSAELIWRRMSDGGATRQSLVVNLGGGMITDLGGFAAATFKRGIRFINLPTTLLGAVDAAVGGKTGVDFNGLKNEIGVFQEAEYVTPLTFMFEYLPEREWLSGCGEVLKTAILAGGNWLETVATDDFFEKRDVGIVNDIVLFCVKFKRKIVSDDFHDRGRRRILNFGHTYGHALETLMLEKGTPLPHGIAVAYGIEYALRLSVERQGVGKNLLRKYRDILSRYFPPVELSSQDKTRISYLMNFDKKNKRFGKPEFVLLGDFCDDTVNL